MYRNLFTKHRSSASSPPCAASYVATINVAFTLNVNPAKKVNGKRWASYSHEEQRAIINRLELKLRIKNPSIKRCEWVFEQGDVKQQIHYHALYSLPKDYVSVLETYFSRIFDYEPSNWGTVDIRPLLYQEDIANWITYMYKTFGAGHWSWQLHEYVFKSDYEGGHSDSGRPSRIER